MICRQLPARPVTRHHIPEELIPRPHCREDPNTRYVKSKRQKSFRSGTASHWLGRCAFRSTEAYVYAALCYKGSCFVKGSRGVCSMNCILHFRILYAYAFIRAFFELLVIKRD